MEETKRKICKGMEETKRKSYASAKGVGGDHPPPPLTLWKRAPLYLQERCYTVDFRQKIGLFGGRGDKNKVHPADRKNIF